MKSNSNVLHTCTFCNLSPCVQPERSTQRHSTRLTVLTKLFHNNSHNKTRHCVWPVTCKYNVSYFSNYHLNVYSIIFHSNLYDCIRGLFQAFPIMILAFVWWIPIYYNGIFYVVLCRPWRRLRTSIKMTSKIVGMASVRKKVGKQQNLHLGAGIYRGTSIFTVEEGA